MSLEEAGNYVVVVTSPMGVATSRTAEVEVYPAPGITVQPVARRIVRGQTTSLTVTATGALGQGGPAKEYALGLMLGLEGAAGIHALAGDSDSIDGSADDAGAFVAPDSLARAQALGHDIPAALARHDSRAVFAALGDLLHTGPTRTNVNDIRLIFVSA
jgi:hydroxypyruvate reductase